MKEYAELENFIRKHYAALHTSALKFVKSEAAAQDITQEVHPILGKSGKMPYYRIGRKFPVCHD